MKPADVGGRQGFGPVHPDAADAPKFHAPWERDVFTLTLAMGAAGQWTLDRSRFMRETLPPADYYASSYYEIWFAALERLIADADLMAEDAPAVRPLQAADVRPRFAMGSPTSRDGSAPRFVLGDRVSVRLGHPDHHTRVPAYVRGRAGTVTAHHGCHVFPDTNAHGQGENPVPLYTVKFSAHDIWGPDTTASDIFVDLFEPYLDTP